MAFDIQALIDKTGMVASFEASLKAAMQAACAQAYEQGVQDGIDRIIEAARKPARAAPGIMAGPAKVPGDGGRVIHRRAKRGLLPVVMARMLADQPGLTTQQYVERIGDYDQTVKENSIGNELRRGEGTRYEKRGRQWFLMNTEVEAEANPESETSASNVHSNQGGHYGTALAE